MIARSAARSPMLLGWLLLGGCTELGAPEESSGDTLTVGVVPYDTHSHYCKQGIQRESAFISMDDENSTHCSYESGDFGEGAWVSPQSAKVPIPKQCEELRTHTMLRFCRAVVASDLFHPLTTDPEDSSRFYATLKFGERCPPHAVEIRKRIINEDLGNRNQPIPAGDLLYPNEVADDLAGNYTELAFCFFRAAPTADEIMTEFPDLGFPYAVFHDFDGPQPSFILRKRWIHSDDSNQSEPQQNRYVPEPETDLAAFAFREIVENPSRDTNYDTYFELGRVR